MMLRLLATLFILLLLGVDLALPWSPLGRRGREAAVRRDVRGAVATVGRPMPEFALRDLDGAPVALADLRGHRVLLTFERSVDW